MKYKATAPGSLMMMGEYGVLYSKQAIVMAIDRGMAVTLTPRSDQTVTIQSSLGEHSTNLEALDDHAAFRFILRSLARYRKHCTQGCDIEIVAEFSPTLGLGSSAAVTVAMVKALDLWLNLHISLQDLIHEARAIVLEVQGIGSGADVAASVMGGVVRYSTQPFIAERLSFDYPLSVIYTGHKTKTVDAITQVKARFGEHPQLFQQILEAIHHCVLRGVNAIQQGAKAELGELWNIQQGLMEALGVTTVNILQALQWLRAQPNIVGAKISGAGLGDCVIGLGAVANMEMSCGIFIPVQVANQGVRGEINE